MQLGFPFAPDAAERPRRRAPFGADQMRGRRFRPHDGERGCPGRNRISLQGYISNDDWGSFPQPKSYKGSSEVDCSAP
jgi:hypothetical protein